VNELTIGSLFSGIGGLELGFERTGRFKTIWHCEIEPYPSAVLEKNFPGVVNYGDITKVDWSKVERPDVLVGGFPCQDISVAGKGQGIKEGTRSGLWSEYARAIRELRPRYVVVENVAMLARRGLVRVLGDLASLGYDAEWFTIRASDVGAPHRRERLFIIAHSNGGDVEAHGEAGVEREVSCAGQGQPSTGDKGSQPLAANAHDKPRAEELLPDQGRNAELSKSIHGTAASNTDHDGTHGQAQSEEGRRGMQAEPHDNADASDPLRLGLQTAADEQVVPREGRDEHIAVEPGVVGEDGGRAGGGADELPAGEAGRTADAPDLRSNAAQGFAQGNVRRFPEFAWCEDIRCVAELFNRPDIPQPLVRGANDGLPKGLDGFIRKERTKALGNAVVPAVAEAVAERLLEIEDGSEVK